MLPDAEELVLLEVDPVKSLEPPVVVEVVEVELCGLSGLPRVLVEVDPPEDDELEDEELDEEELDEELEPPVLSRTRSIRLG